MIDDRRGNGEAQSTASLTYIKHTLSFCHLKNRSCAGQSNLFLLSLYSTAMQNPSRWGFALGNTSNVRILRWGYQHVGIKKGCGANANPKICVTPNRTLNARRWNIGCVGSSCVWARIGHVHFMFFFIDFICVGYPTQTHFFVEYGF